LLSAALPAVTVLAAKPLVLFWFDAFELHQVDAGLELEPEGAARADVQS
jgi:hypothetical protein